MDERKPESAMTPLTANNQLDHILRTNKLQITMMAEMADKKASIMTGLAVVMLSVIFGYVQNNGATASLGVFGLAVLISAMTAVFAVLPSRKKLGEKMHRNPFFFGHAAAVSEDEYVREISGILSDETTAYEALIRDIHQLSKVTTRKYRLISLSYQILLIGFFASAVTFVVEIVLKANA